VRRRAGLAAVLVLLALALAPFGVATPARAAATAATPVAATPIQHFVMLMQANHSFDSYFGTYPGADGIPAGTCLPVDTAAPAAATCVRPFPLRDEPPEVLDRTAAVQRRQFDDGKMDGFVAAYRALGRDGTTAMGYYDGADIPFYWNVANEYTLFDRFFSAATVGTRLNAFYWVAGIPTPSGSEQVPPGGYGDIPTVFDRLEARGVSWKFYVENHDPAATFRTGSPATARVPLLSFARFVDDPALAAHIVDLSEYFRDMAAGTLPAVSYVVSNGSSENPPGRIADGQTLVHRLVSALETSSAWNSSAFLWTYSGWGGSYDHVPPPVLDLYGPGFRVPALLVSPYSRRGAVDHTALDFTAALKFVETNWGVPALGSRDAMSPGLASAFDFTAPPRPPQLLGLDRPSEPLVGGRTRWVVYGSYGGILLVAAASVWLPGHLRRRSATRSAAPVVAR
jgi:phospholipase C